jgi:hypothetical protein
MSRVSGDIYFVNLYLSTYPLSSQDPDNCFIDEYLILKYSIKNPQIYQDITDMKY